MSDPALEFFASLSDSLIREWYRFENPKGALDELSPHPDAEAEELSRSFAKNCDCLITSETVEARYVLIFSWHDLKFVASFAPKRYALLKADGARLGPKGSVRLVKNIVSDSCKAVRKGPKNYTPVSGRGRPGLRRSLLSIYDELDGAQYRHPYQVQGGRDQEERDHELAGDLRRVDLVPRREYRRQVPPVTGLKPEGRQERT